MSQLISLENNLKKVAFFLVAAALFSALIFLPNILRPFILGKMFPFQIATLLLLVVWAILMIINFQKYRPRFNLLTIAVSVFYLAILISCIFSLVPYRSFWGNAERMEGFISLLHFYVFFLAISSIFFNDKEAIRKLVFTSICISFFGAIFPILEVFRIVAIPTGESLNRPGGVFGNPTFFAGFLLVHLFLIVWYYLNFAHKSELKQQKNLVIIIGVISFFVFLWAQTRGSILGLVFGLFVGLVLSIFTIPNKQYKKISAIVAGGIVILGILFFVFQPQIQKSVISEKIPFIGRLASISLSDASTRARILNWQRSFNWWKERPIFGYGQDMYYAVFDSHYDANDYALSHERFDRAHNKFFDVLVMNGIVGFLAYVFLLIVVGYLIFKKIKISEKFQDKISWIFIFSLFIAYNVHNFFVFDTPANSIFFFFFLAFVNLSTEDIKIKKASSEKKIEQKIFIPKKAFDVLDLLIIGIILLIAAFIFYHVDYKPYKAAQLVYEANRVNPQDLAGRFQTFEKAVKLNTFINTEIKKPWADYFFSYLTYSSSGQIKADKNQVVNFYEKIKEQLLSGYKREPMVDFYVYLSYIASQMPKQPNLSDEERQKYYSEMDEYFGFLKKNYSKRSDFLMQYVLSQPSKEKTQKELAELLEKTPKYAPAWWLKAILAIQDGKNEEEVFEYINTAFDNGYEFYLEKSSDFIMNVVSQITLFQTRGKMIGLIDEEISKTEKLLQNEKLNAFQKGILLNKVKSLIDLAVFIEISNPPKDADHINKVINYLEKANQYQKNRLEILIKLAAAYAQLHNKEKAIEYAQQVLKVDSRYATDVREFINLVEQEQWDKLF
jgi:O-antigen ligase